MAPSQIVGAILAGGRGVRMAHFADRHPKPLLPILNRPLMVHQIERLSAAHIDEIFVVVGHLGYEIARVLGDGAAYGVRLHYVEQAETLGIAHAVVVSQPVRIERSVIFDRCEIRRNVSDAIVTPETFVDCSYDRQKKGG